MIVKVKNVVKRYSEKLALDHFNMEVKEGEILGLLGPNGWENNSHKLYPVST